MGCLFSKKSTSTSAPGDRAKTSTRVQHISSSESNGIVRIPKYGQENSGNQESSYHETPQLNRHQLRIKPPPPGPPPSPPSLVTSPKPEPTEPPTPEDERPTLHVQYAEDLEPVTPLPVEELMSSSRVGEMMTSSRGDNTHSRSKVSISNVTLKPNVNGIRSAPMPLQDLSIEELDTEIDEFNRFRGKRFSFREGENFNPVTTDILLPRRKDSSSQDKRQQNNADKTDNKTDTTEVESNHKPLRTDTPYPSLSISDRTNLKDIDVPLKVEEISDYATVALYEKADPRRSENDNLTMTKLDVASEREENIVTFDMSKDKRFAETVKNKKTGALSSKSDHLKSRPGTLTDIHVQTTKELQSASHSQAISKTMYEKDLEKSRKSRKRKLNRNRKSDYTPRPGSEAVKVNENDAFIGRTSKSFKERPDSGTSTWTTNTLDSKRTLGSTDTLVNFDMETGTETKPDRYSYISSGTTPISSKNFSVDENTEIIDLEDNGDLNDDSWLTDDQFDVKTNEPFDVWYGMKPYEVVTANGRNDAGMVKAIAAGPSSSENSTKQKLMYSRFARRPQSESVLRMASKPPLPPGTDRKMRPVSDTVNRPRAMSRYFTTDLDIH